MRIPILLPGLLAAVLVPCAAGAQATVDSHALEQLQPAPPAAAPPAAAPPAKRAPPARPRPPARAAAQRAPAQPAPATTAHPAAAPPPTAPPSRAMATPPPPTPEVHVPLAPPPPPVLPPPLVVPMRSPPPPAPAAVVNSAPGDATPLPDGVRITFGAGTADLNPATDDALRALAHDAPADARFNVTAFAPGAPEDPSTPRRTSLSRALAVRSVLIAQGISSDRIYARALGATGEIADGPPNRADVTVLETNPQARSSK